MLFSHRRIYFIKKDFQSRFILRFVTTATVWAAATVVLFVIMAERRLDDIRYSTHISIKTTAELLLPSAMNAQFITLLIFAGTLAYAIHTLWERLAIPLGGIKKDIGRIAGGDLLSSVTVRDGEEFQDLASDLDGMRNELRRKFIRLKEGQTALFVAAEGLQKSILKGNPSLSQASALKDAVSRMKEEIHAFNY